MPTIDLGACHLEIQYYTIQFVQHEELSMAKRKLSPEQRTKLRAELAEAVKAKRKTPEVLEEISKKYGITTITARWYLNSLDGKPRRKAGRRGPGRPRGRRPGRPAQVN